MASNGFGAPIGGRGNHSSIRMLIEDADERNRLTARQACLRFDIPRLKQLSGNHELQRQAATKQDREACRVFGQYLDTRQLDGLQRVGLSWHEKADAMIAEEIGRLVREMDSITSLLDERVG